MKSRIKVGVKEIIKPVVLKVQLSRREGDIDMTNLH